MSETAEAEEIRIAPQPGPQEAFLACSADVAFYGGAAGGGKTFALLLDALRFLCSIKGFAAVIFRRESPEITNPGGLWDESQKLYPLAGGVPTQSAGKWIWPGFGWLKFSHLQLEIDVFKWQGAQVAFLGFDELTHFSKQQFFYLLSRNRSTCGVRPYVRGTMNPDPDSWVRKFIDWWIDPVTGYAIPERSGVVRWFARDGDAIVWGDSREEMEAKGHRPKSFTFIPARVEDNAILMQADPDYVANLATQCLVDRERLLLGNWNVRAVAGMVFKRTWWRIVEAAPAGGRTIRYWDRASTPVSDISPDPDWTVGLRMKLADDGIFYIEDVCREREAPDGVLRIMRACADQDGEDCEVWAEQDPGQAGVSEVNYLSKKFADRVFRYAPVSTSKFARAKPLSAHAEAGNVRLVRGAWNDAFIAELEAFANWEEIPKEHRPKSLPKDDQVDGASGAFNKLATGVPRVRSTN